MSRMVPLYVASLLVSLAVGAGLPGDAAAPRGKDQPKPVGPEPTAKYRGKSCGEEWRVRVAAAWMKRQT